ncbi:MAG: glycosyltransferase family 1 protein [Flavobacterium sp.]|nr:MAG: glycosyltransferase family 1 protein [Flavobacterium sp.]
MENHSNQIKIFVDCHVFDGGFQGTRSYIKGLYAELVKDKSRHFFLAANDTEKLKKEFGEEDNITFLKYRSGNKFIRLALETPYLIKKHGIDFAHFQYRVPPIKCCRYIVTTHDVLFEDFPEYFPKMNRHSSLITYKYSAKMSDIVFTVSEYSKQEIAQYLGVNTAVVMPNGIESIFFEHYNKEAVKQQIKETYGLDDYLIYISRREPRKSQHLLLKHFIDLNLHEHLSLVLVGHETFKNPEFEVIYNALEPNVRKKILLIDNLGFQKMLPMLRGAKACVYPSIAEGFGIPPLEAVAAKIPTICSNQTAMADFDFFKNDFFNPFDENEFREKLHKIAIQPSDGNQLEERKAIVKARYNWQNAADIFNRELQKFL